MHVLSLWHTLPRPLRIVVMRCLMIVPQMLGVTLVAFLMVRLLPGDPARLILGNFATADSSRIPWPLMAASIAKPTGVRGRFHGATFRFPHPPARPPKETGFETPETGSKWRCLAYHSLAGEEIETQRDFWRVTARRRIRPLRDCDCRLRPLACKPLM
jgi:hypothetical protein